MSRRRQQSKFKFSRFYGTSKRRPVIAIVSVLLIGVLGIYLASQSFAQWWQGGGGGGGGGAISYTVTPAANPAIQSCTTDINIALVQDVSGSIDDGELGDAETAYKNIVSDLLPGTKAMFSVTEFGSSAAVLQGFTNNVSALDNAINGLRVTGNVGSSTNWPAGLQTGYGTFAGTNPKIPRLLIIATDGDPTPANTQTMNDSITAANTIKGAKIHSLAIGLGSGPNVANLQAISGPNVSNDVSNMTVNTDVVTTTFAQLGSALLHILSGGCGSGNGIGSGGTGIGTNGNGKGENGKGKGSSGTGTGNSASTTPKPAAAPTPKPDNKPKPAPKPTAQGTKPKPPQPTPSPFFDGKQFAAGSATDQLAGATVHRGPSGIWYIVTAIVLAGLAGAGYIAWRKGMLPIQSITPKERKPRSR